MNTKNTSDTTSNAPSMPYMVGESTYYALFAPGGAYHDYFEEMLAETAKEKDMLYILISFASMGVICGKKEARKKGGTI